MALNPQSEAAREALRRANGVRLVRTEEEGAAVNTLPAGVFGFTGSPALASPLFAVPRYRNFEVHHTAAGETVLIACVTAAEAGKLRAVADLVDLTAYPDLTAESTTIVAIPYHRIVHHRQYAIRNSPGIDLRVRPAPETVTT